MVLCTFCMAHMIVYYIYSGCGALKFHNSINVWIKKKNKPGVFLTQRSGISCGFLVGIRCNACNPVLLLLTGFVRVLETLKMLEF